MSKILLINGSPNEYGCTYTALKEIADTLSRNDVETEILYLGKKPIAGCVACGKCAETKRCVFHDSVNEVLDRIDEFDAIVVGSPVYYAGPAGQLTAFLDRLFFLKEDLMAGKLGASVVSCRRGGATAAFDRLNKYFTISNMPIVSREYLHRCTRSICGLILSANFFKYISLIFFWKINRLNILVPAHLHLQCCFFHQLLLRTTCITALRSFPETLHVPAALLPLFLRQIRLQVRAG